MIKRRLSPTASPTVGLGAALLAMACVLAVLVHRHPEKLHAPGWIAFFALGLFGFAGLCVIAQALRLSAVARWLACALLGGMAITSGWIALGNGARQCTLISLGSRSPASEALCRGAFGFGTVMLLAMFVLAVRDASQTRRAEQANEKSKKSV